LLQPLPVCVVVLGLMVQQSNVITAQHGVLAILALGLKMKMGGILDDNMG